MRGAVEVLEHADGLQRLGDPLVELVPAQPEVARAEGHVVADRTLIGATAPLGGSPRDTIARCTRSPRS